MQDKSYIRLKKNGEIVHRPSKEYLNNININEYMSCVIDHKNIIHEHYSLLNEYYGNDIPYDVISEFKFNPFNDYIFENLNTHDADKLISALQRKYKDFDVYERDSHIGKNRYLSLCVDGFGFYKIYKSDEFDNLIAFFGYSKSSMDVNRYGDHCTIMLEPIYADKDEANDLVYNKCHGFIYHITDESRYKSILENGFRITGQDTVEKTGRKPRYRNYPNRTYFVAIPPGGTKQVLNSDEMEMSVLNYYKGRDVFRDNIYIFRICVASLDINFYRDSVSISIDGGKSPAVYCYCNIPPKYIELVFDGTLDELKV